jgi:hypothetical protein
VVTGLSDDSAAGTAPTVQRAVPYHCPFCAEEDLRPLESGAVLSSGTQVQRPAWHCRSCLRAFSLTFHGLHSPAAADLQPTALPRTSGSDRG